MVKVYNLCRVKTVITAVLTVKSDMDPHMISWFGMVGLVRLWFSFRVWFMLEIENYLELILYI